MNKKRSAQAMLDELEPDEAEAVEGEGVKGKGKGKKQREEVEYEAEVPYIIRLRDALFEKYQFRYNEITDVLEYTRDEGETWTLFLYEHLNSLWIEFQLSREFGAKEKPGVALLERILNSDFVPRYNAVRDYLDGLKWDGSTDYIGQLAATVNVTHIDLNAETVLSRLWEPLLRRWLIAAAACAAGRGPNQVMLLLIGAQGTFKTTWLNRLCPPALADYRFTGHINPDLTENRTADLLAEKAFLNIDDQLETIFGKDFNKIKSVITIDYINNRKAFRKDAKRRPRIANILGSVNTDKIFLDVENRRYLTFKVDSIDINRTVDMDGVWSQAWALLKGGERHWFDAAEVSTLNLINSAFAVNTPEVEWLLRCYEPAEETELGAKWVMFNELLTTISTAAGKNLRDGHLRNAMKKLEWPEPRSRRIAGKSFPVYAYPVKELFLRGDYGKIILDNN